MTGKKAVKRAGWIFESFSWHVLFPFYRIILLKRSPLDISIGITTYMDRFENCLKPLVSKLTVLFPSEQIIIMANGHYLSNEQKVYMEELNAFCGRFPNVEAESYSDPRGLSFLWNRIIKKSVSDNILILNDDIRVKAGFRRFMEKSGIIDSEIATINSSWSHFEISKNIINKIGIFDEAFREIGGEDDDYLARLALYGANPGNYFSDTISGSRRKKSHIKGLNSYGRDMSKEPGGYSLLNTRHLFEKWETSDNYFDGAVEVPGRKMRYWKLRKKGN